ncbi:MAG TPA: pilus assembly protein TadG-related protein [Jatrophihabitans sp.]
MNDHDDSGSTLPLILGFFLIALLMVAGSVAAGDAFVQQRSLQDVCDGAATAAAASGVDLGRGGALESEQQLQFGDVRTAVGDYLARDPARHEVRVSAHLSADRRTLSLTCEQTAPIAFGAMFGKGGGVHHVATASAQAPLS